MTRTYAYPRLESTTTTAVSPPVLTLEAESIRMTFGSVETTVTLTGANGLSVVRDRVAVYTVALYGGSVVRRVLGRPPWTRLTASGVMLIFAGTYPGAVATTESVRLESSAQISKYWLEFWPFRIRTVSAVSVSSVGSKRRSATFTVSGTLPPTTYT